MHRYPLLALVVIALAGAPSGRAQDYPGHAQFHNIYRGWVTKNGFSSCCNGDDPAKGIKGDCRPAKAYKDPDDDLWRVLIDGTWRVVPADKVRPYPTPDGNSHVCENETQGIMCFVGGKPKG
jgi:hypothetical protein